MYKFHKIQTFSVSKIFDTEISIPKLISNIFLIPKLLKNAKILEFENFDTEIIK